MVAALYFASFSASSDVSVCWEKSISTPTCRHAPFFFFAVDGEYPGTKPRDVISLSAQVNSLEGVIGDAALLSAQEEALKEWKSRVIGTESPAHQFPGAAGGKEQVGKKRAQWGRLENTLQLINSPNFFNKQAE